MFANKERKIQRFGMSLWAKFLPGRLFDTLQHSQKELDVKVEEYNLSRLQQVLGKKIVLKAFTASQAALVGS